MKPHDSKKLDTREPIPGPAHLSCDRVVLHLEEFNTQTRAGIFVGLMLAGARRSRRGADNGRNTGTFGT